MMQSVLEDIGNTPLMPLHRIARGLPVQVLVKCEHLNPGGSVKDRIALAIVDDAERRGLIRPGATLIEATAGNTGIGLALVAATRGYRLVCVMPEKMSADKRTALATVGAEVVIAPNAHPDDPNHFQNLARRLAHQHNYFLTDQFENPVNSLVHEETTGPEILMAAGGDIGAFVSGAGTGGTITGVGRYLRMACPGARVILADPLGSALGHWVEHGTLGPEAPYEVEGIGGSRPPGNLDRKVIDSVETVSDEESFAMARRLCREEGLLVGGSAGTAVVAALRVAAHSRLQGPVVALLADSWDRYQSRPWMSAP
jgi:cysteine synthase